MRVNKSLQVVSVEELERQELEADKEKTYDLVGAIIDFESGDLDGEDTLKLFGHLIKTGQAWSLQGSYGRFAASLIDQGAISRDGVVLVDASGEALDG